MKLAYTTLLFCVVFAEVVLVEEAGDEYLDSADKYPEDGVSGATRGVFQGTKVLKFGFFRSRKALI